MNYLELCNGVLERVNEAALTSATFSSSSLVGPQSVVKQYILDTINDIMTREQEWPFMFVEGSQTLVAGTYIYNEPTSASWTDFDSFYVDYNASLGGEEVTASKLTEVEYKVFRRTGIAALENTNETDKYQKPSKVYSMPGRRWGIDYKPDKTYTLSFDYYKIPVQMSAFDDTPDIPEQYHQVILDGATKRMYDFRGDIEQAAGYRDAFKAGIKGMQHSLIRKRKAMGVR